MFCAMSSLYHHFIGMQRGQTRGGVLSVEKDKGVILLMDERFTS